MLIERMNAKKRILLGAAGLAVAAITAYAAGTVSSEIFRTTGYFIGIAQGTNTVTGKPIYENASFAGHNLVNLAMGRSLGDTNYPQQVMAMTFACDLSSASLVVYDLSLSNVVATIATSTSIDTVKAQDAKVAGPNRAHFVAVLQVGANGNETNGLLGGYFTVAGRVNLNPITGCPQPVLVALDRDSLDRLVDDMELPSSVDPDPVALRLRTGLAHLIGVVDTIDNGTTNTILVPYGGLSIRRELGAESSPVVSPGT
jgi:hypothetical protein